MIMPKAGQRREMARLRASSTSRMSDNASAYLFCV